MELDLKKKASTAVMLARQLLPGQSEAHIKSQAIDLMDLPTLSLHRTLSRVAAVKKASVSPSKEQKEAALKISGLLKLSKVQGERLASLDKSVLLAITNRLAKTDEVRTFPEKVWLKSSEGEPVLIKRSDDGYQSEDGVVQLLMEEPVVVPESVPENGVEADPGFSLAPGQTVLTKDNRIGEIVEIQTVEDVGGSKRLFTVGFDSGDAIFAVTEDEITPVVVEYVETLEPESIEELPVVIDEAPAEVIDEAPAEVIDEAPAEVLEELPEEIPDELKEPERKESAPPEPLVASDEPDDGNEIFDDAVSVEEIEITAEEEAEFERQFLGGPIVSKRANAALKLNKILNSPESAEMSSLFEDYPDISGLLK